MVYKNLILRLIFSIIFAGIYLFALSNKYLMFTFGTIIYLFVFYEILKFFKINSKLIISYLLLSYSCFTLYFLIFFDFYIFNILIITIIMFDSFSYLIGILLGKYYIFKKISPKKTLEGYLGGIFFTNIFFLIYLFFIQTKIEIILFIILINLIIFISIIGDLIESYFKRINNIKDSSKYLPGHGGFFDRFDSFIASIILLTLYSSFNL